MPSTKVRDPTNSGNRSDRINSNKTGPPVSFKGKLQYRNWRSQAPNRAYSNTSDTGDRGERVDLRQQVEDLIMELQNTRREKNADTLVSTALRKAQSNNCTSQKSICNLSDGNADSTNSRYVKRTSIIQSLHGKEALVNHQGRPTATPRDIINCIESSIKRTTRVRDDSAGIVLNLSCKRFTVYGGLNLCPTPGYYNKI